jgi:hypothetical protein
MVPRKLLSRAGVSSGGGGIEEHSHIKTNINGEETNAKEKYFSTAASSIKMEVIYP